MKKYLKLILIPIMILAALSSTFLYSPQSSALSECEEQYQKLKELGATDEELQTFMTDCQKKEKSSKSDSTSKGGNCEPFLGMIPWNCGINPEEIKNQDILKSKIWTIVANIASDITIAAAYLIIGYVIYGGYLYIFSAGDPGKVATGKKALHQAFMGLAIVMSAYVIISFIRIALIGSDASLADCVNESCVEPGFLIVNAIQTAIGIAGVIAVIFVVYGGTSYMTSQGDPGKLQKAKQMITYALIGLIIVALAEIITAFTSNIIRDAQNTSMKPINQTIISKENHNV